MKTIEFDTIPQVIEDKNIDFSIEVKWSDGYDTTIRLYSDNGYMLEGVILGCCFNNVLMVTNAYAEVTEEELNKDIISTINANGSAASLWGKHHWEYNRTVKCKKGDVIAFNRHEFVLNED